MIDLEGASILETYIPQIVILTERKGVSSFFI